MIHPQRVAELRRHIEEWSAAHCTGTIRYVNPDILCAKTQSMDQMELVVQIQRIRSSGGFCWKRFLAAGVLIAMAASVAVPCWAEEEPVLAGEDFIAVKNPKRLPARIPCTRIPLGLPADYKPCIALLKSGDLFVVAFAERQKEGKRDEYFISFRSSDGGLNWGPRTELNNGIVSAREPFTTVLKDGTVLMSAHILPNDPDNIMPGRWYSFIFRSADEGHTWSTMLLGPENWPKKDSVATDRRAVQLHDGTVLMGVSTGLPDVRTAMWRSTDSGKTWDKSTVCENEGWRDAGGFFTNSETFLLKSGKLLHINRVDGRNYPLKGGPPPAELGDHTNRSILWESTDEGKTWRRVRDMGGYGMMYPQLLQLKDGRILYNFTIRGLAYPLGIQAVVNYDQGEVWDLETDRIIIASKTTKGMDSGGGYGNTIQLADGTLVTSYSYRGKDDNTHLEVVRWRLADSN